MKTFFSPFFRSVEKDFKDHFFKVLIVIALLAIVYILSEQIFLSFIIAGIATVVLLGWDGRIFFGFGLLFLVFCPFLLAFNNKIIAEEIAVYSYYMLAIGVLLQFFENFKKEFLKPSRSKRKAVSSQVFTKTQLMKVVLVPVCAVLLLASVAGYVVYSNMNRSLQETKQLIVDLTQKQEMQTSAPVSPEEQVSSSVNDQSTRVPAVSVKNDPSLEWDLVAVSLENGSGDQALESMLVREFDKIGVINLKTHNTQELLFDSTVVEYCSSCLNVASELVSLLKETDRLIMVEQTEYTNQIVIRLGTDQLQEVDTEVVASM